MDMNAVFIELKFGFSHTCPSDMKKNNYKRLEMLLRAVFYAFLNIAFFELFENHHQHMLKLLKPFCFRLNMVEELDRNERQIFQDCPIYPVLM